MTPSLFTRGSIKSALLLTAASISATLTIGTATEAQAQTIDDEIIVTATRRSESLQDVPIAVTAILPEDIEKQGIVNIQNLGSVAPSFATSNAQIASGSVVLRVRGIGTTSNNIGFESAVGVFIDGAYQSRPGIALGEFVDVERVEVLRGPQGTLFGRNTSAGALNIINVRPDLEEFGGFINATYGNFDQQSVQGAINIPLAEGKVAARLTGAIRNREGYVDIVDANGVEIGESNDVDQILLRGQIGFEGEEKWKGRVIFDYSTSESVCCSAIEIQQSPVEAAGLFGAVGLGARGGMAGPDFAITPDDTGLAQDAVDNRIATSLQVPDNRSDQYGVTGEIEYALNDNTDVIYIGSFRHFEANDTFDSAFSGLDLFNIIDQETNIDTLTQELRVQGDLWDGRLSWLVGGYYSDEEIAFGGTNALGTDFSQFSDALLLAGTGGAFPTPGLLAAGGTLPFISGGANPGEASTDTLFLQDSRSLSIFTHNTFELTDKLDITLGLRYTDESKTGSFSQPEVSFDSCSGQLANFDGATGTFAPAPAALTGTLTVLGCFPFLAPADEPLAFASPLPLPRTFDDDFNDDELIYTGKIGYELTPDISTYASFTHGFKTGGFNLDATAAIGGADPTFASEEVDSYEVGVKSKLFNDLLTLNVAAFYQDLENFQVLEFTGAQFTTFNVPNARSRGVEIESTLRPTDNILINGGLTVLDASYPDDCAGDLTSINVLGLCGNSLTNAPSFVGILGANYDGEFGSNFTYFLNANARYEGDRRTSTQAIILPGAADIAAAGSVEAAIDAAAPNPFDVQDATVKINLRAGIGNVAGDWSLEAWATNVTNQVTRGVTFNTTLRSGSRSAFIQDPRFYGVTARKNF